MIVRSCINKPRGTHASLLVTALVKFVPKNRNTLVLHHVRIFMIFLFFYPSAVSAKFMAKNQNVLIANVIFLSYSLF